MSDLTVAEAEHGVVRVFAIDLPLADAQERFGNDPAALAGALGLDTLNDRYVDLLDPRPEGGLGLSGFLTQGLGLPANQIDPVAAQLDGLGEAVVVISSGAFGGEAVQLHPEPPLRLAFRFAEEVKIPDMTPLRSAAAEGVVGEAPARKKPSDAALSGRIAMLALLVMFVLVGLMIWIAG